ncbi:hypothetical protein J437_LFUL019744, partial [Ladona fulva]
MMGHSIYDYTHPCDHDEITEILSAKSATFPSIPRSFFIRLKCTLTSKGRNVNVKSATYKLVNGIHQNSMIPDAGHKKEVKTNSNDALFLKALEGFLMVVSGDGELVFLSDNVNQYLGLTQ